MYPYKLLHMLRQSVVRSEFAEGELGLLLLLLLPLLLLLRVAVAVTVYRRTPTPTRNAVHYRSDRAGIV